MGDAARKWCRKGEIKLEEAPCARSYSHVEEVSGELIHPAYHILVGKLSEMRRERVALSRDEAITTANDGLPSRPARPLS